MQRNLSPTPKTPVELLLIFKRFGYVGIDFFKKEDIIAVLEGKSVKQPCLPSLVMDYLQCVLNMQLSAPPRHSLRQGLSAVQAGFELREILPTLSALPCLVLFFFSF